MNTCPLCGLQTYGMTSIGYVPTGQAVVVDLAQLREHLTAAHPTTRLVVAS